MRVSRENALITGISETFSLSISISISTSISLAMYQFLEFNAAALAHRYYSQSISGEIIADEKSPLARRDPYFAKLIIIARAGTRFPLV